MDERILGTFLMVGSVCALLLYGIFLFSGDLAYFVLKLTAFIAVSFILLVSFWIGNSLFTTPTVQEFDIYDSGAEKDD